MPKRKTYAEARRQVKHLTGFYIHLTVFALVMVLLASIDMLAGPRWWAHWPLLIWGSILLAHAVAVFAHIGTTIREWQARKVRAIMHGE
jgi:hypothetical protein